MENTTAICTGQQIVYGEKTEINTAVGKLTPAYSFSEEGRKKEDVVTCYPSGEIRAVPLENATVIDTPIGDFSCELVTFYRSGKLRRVFPLNGRISAYWTENDEYNLAEILEIPAGEGIIRVKPIYIQFYETGELQSIAFWPNETVELKTPAGMISCRKGVSFHKNGGVAGCEPSEETSVETPIGQLIAYDPDPEGIKAESGTIVFDSSGSVIAAATVSNVIIVDKGQPGEIRFTPDIVYSYCDESMYSVVPLRMKFENDKVILINKSGAFPVSDARMRSDVGEFIFNEAVSEPLCHV